MQRSAAADVDTPQAGHAVTTPPPKASAPDASLWQRGWALLEARERRMAWIVLAIVVASAISAAVMVGSVLPFLTVLSDPTRIETVPQLAWVYERLGFGTQYQFIVALGLATIVMIVVANGMQMLRLYVVERFTMMRVHNMSHRLLARYLDQPYEFFLTAHTSDMSARILNETNNVVQYFLRPAAEVISATITLLLVLGVVIWIDPWIALSAIVVLGTVFSVVFYFSSRKLAVMGQVRSQANKGRFRATNETLAGIKDIKLLGSGPFFLSRFADNSLKMIRSTIGKRILTQLPPYLIQSIVFAGVILICLLMLDGGAADPAQAMAELVPKLGAMALAAQRMMPELGRLFSSIGSLRYGHAAVDVVYEGLIAGAQPDRPVAQSQTPLRLQTALELDRISYRYPNADRAGLDNVTLDIRAGERIGVVGTSGAGKTTLADILLGLLEPTSGQIRADGVSITKDQLPAWRRTVGYVPQEIYLLDASVAENIAFGIHAGKIDRAKVETAAQMAQLDAFVNAELPEGYDTPIGERGLRLSGGQRQRIGIARALYRDADFIVFDEATSALDNVTEKEVMASMEALPGDKTILMIAHRLSTVRRCDRILLLDKGQVAGFDTWERLEADNPTFQAIVRGGQEDA